MKKMTMIAAAMLSLSALADAQLYEVQLTVKTTTTASGQARMVACDCRTDKDSIYRKQGNVKIKGVIWGCDCGTLIKEQPFTSPTEPFGYFFWNETSRKPLNVKLTWQICNRIDKTARKAEAVWTLTSEDGTFNITCAGFGTIKDTVTKKPCMLVASWFPSLNGNLAGWMAPGAVVTTKATEGTCTWCEKVAGTSEVTATASGWGICSDCTESSKVSGSAASGTWRIKYNARASKTLENSTSILEAYRFPDYVKAVMQ